MNPTEVIQALEYLALATVIATIVCIAGIVWLDMRERKGGAYRRRY